MQQMKCPECKKSVSIFCPELNTWEKTKSCPHCQIPLRLQVNYWKSLAWLIPLVIFSIGATLLTAPGWEAWFTGVAAGIAVLLSLEAVACQDKEAE